MRLTTRPARYAAAVAAAVCRAHRLLVRGRQPGRPAVGQQARGRGGRRLRGRHHDGRDRRRRHHHDRHQVRPAGFGLLNPSGAPGLRRRDRQDHRRQAGPGRGPDRVRGDPSRPTGSRSSRTARSTWSSRPTRSTTPASGEVDFRRPVLRGRPGHHGRRRQPRGHRGPDDLAGKNVCSVEGLDPGAEHPGQTTPRPR